MSTHHILLVEALLLLSSSSHWGTAHDGVGVAEVPLKLLRVAFVPSPHSNSLCWELVLVAGQSGMEKVVYSCS